MNLENILEKYVDGCKKYGEGMVTSLDHKATNRAYDAMLENLRILVKDSEGKTKLKELLTHDNNFVSSCTAMMVIFEYEKDCKKVLKKTIKAGGVWGTIVKYFYEEWKKGFMKRMY